MARKLIEQRTKGKRFFHDSLASVEAWLDGEIESVCSGQVLPGWKDRVVAGIIVVAIHNEAFFNALGMRAIDDWKHEDNFKAKLKKLRKTLTPTIEANERPFASVEKLRLLRNEICHSRPEVDDDEVVKVMEVDREADFTFDGLNHSVEKKISYASYKRFRNDSNAYRKLAMEASGLKDWDLCSSEESSETFLGYVEIDGS